MVFYFERTFWFRHQIREKIIWSEAVATFRYASLGSQVEGWSHQCEDDRLRYQSSVKVD